MDAGAAVLLSCGDVGAKDYPVPTEFLTLRIPRRLLNSVAAKPEDALARPIPANKEALRLLVDYVQLTLKNRQPISPELRRLFAAHISDLVALAVGATRDGAEMTRRRGLRAARLAAIKGDVARRLGDERLTVTDIACAEACHRAMFNCCSSPRGQRSRNTSSSKGLPAPTARSRIPHCTIGRSAPSHSKSDSAIYRISIASSGDVLA